MPAQDKIHHTVIHALEKRGWRVVREHYKLYLPPKQSLFIDLLITNLESGQSNLVEIKTFDESASPSEALANALGKYLIYRQALNALKIPIPLMLAIPEMAYNTILRMSWFTPLLDQLQLHLIVINTQTEEIVLWT